MIRAGKDKHGLPYAYCVQYPAWVYLLPIGITVGAGIIVSSLCNTRELYHKSLQNQKINSNQDKEPNSRKQESWLESQTTKPSEELRIDFVKE